jgi:hypothetical protein
MADQAPCPHCLHANPPENRFCGWCGASLGARTDLVARWEGKPTVMGHALPAKPGPVGKALVVGLVTLAVRTDSSWPSAAWRASSSSTLLARNCSVVMSPSRCRSSRRSRLRSISGNLSRSWLTKIPGYRFQVLLTAAGVHFS